MNLSDVQNKEEAIEYVETHIGMLVTEVNRYKDVTNNEKLMEKLAKAFLSLVKLKQKLLSKKSKMNSGDANELIGINLVIKHIMEVEIRYCRDTETLNTTKPEYVEPITLGSMGAEGDKIIEQHDSFDAFCDQVFGNPSGKDDEDEWDDYDEDEDE